MKRNGKTERFFGVITMLLVMITAAGCLCRSGIGDFTDSETALIREALNADGTAFPKGTMRVLTVCDSADLAILRAPSSDMSSRALLSDDYRQLCSLMVATVTHPSQDGVGIAGPQIGLNRRVVAVQRFDKEPVVNGSRLDHPFEVYANIRIVWASDSLAVGPEGCLSVPDRRGDVLRSTEIVIEHADINALSKDCKEIPIVRDTVSGFTAVIFQHEIDHLDGILYIDRL